MKNPLYYSGSVRPADVGPVFVCDSVVFVCGLVISMPCSFLLSLISFCEKIKAGMVIRKDMAASKALTLIRVNRMLSMSYKWHAPLDPHVSFHVKQVLSNSLPYAIGAGRNTETKTKHAQIVYQQMHKSKDIPQKRFAIQILKKFHLSET